MQFQDGTYKEKSFWKRPEGITGLLFLGALGALGVYILSAVDLSLLLSNTLYMAGTLAILATVVYLVLDPKMRNLVWYGYKSIMRAITGWFVNIDPIGILKSYIESLQDNLVKMREQIGKLRGQMRHLQTLISDNEKEIDNQLRLAAAARDKGIEQQMVLSSRKAARLQESNQKYGVLVQKIDVLYRILTKMHDNSEILLEDTKDQVQLKEQERKAIRASHSAMKSAMSVISGDPDQRAMFDMAMEAIAEDVASKVGEMERFMEMSSNFMQSIDLQNGVFEEKGLQMLEQWEKESTLMLLGDGKKAGSSDGLDLRPLSRESGEESTRQAGGNQSYDQFFK